MCGLACGFNRQGRSAKYEVRSMQTSFCPSYFVLRTSYFRSFRHQAADQVGDFLDAMLDAPGAYAFHDFFRGARVEVIGSADLHRGRASQQKLDNVCSGSNAAQADDGNVHRMRGFIYHAQRDGLDGRPAQPGGDIGNARPASLSVNRHGDESVDQRDGVSPGVFRGAGHARDAGDVGRELDDHRPGPSGILGGDHNFFQRHWITAEYDAAMLGVGAGDVQLVSGDAFAFIEDADAALVFLAAVSEDIADHHYILFLAQLRQLFFYESAGADVLQADGVKHAGGSLEDARRGIAGHGLRRESFGDKAAQLFQSDDFFEFNAVAEGAAGGENRILEANAAELDRQIGHRYGAGRGRQRFGQQGGFRRSCFRRRFLRRRGFRRNFFRWC